MQVIKLMVRVVKDRIIISTST